MTRDEFSQALKEGLEIWVAETAAEKIKELKEIENNIESLNNQLQLLYNKRNAVLKNLPNGMPCALGYYELGTSISIMPHCYALAKHKNITFEQAKSELLESFRNTG